MLPLASMKQTSGFFSVRVLGFGVLVTGMLFSGLTHARDFTIKKGDHASSPRVVRFFSGTSMNLGFVFDESANYQFTGSAASDQLDTNKLYGFSDCKSHHSENSARFGWRSNQGRVEVMAFTHRSGKFYYESLGFVETNQFNRGSISLSEDRKNYIYEMNGTRLEVERGCEDAKAVGYALHPYFGGNQVAPHEIRIRVDAGGELAPVFADIPYPTVLNGGAFKMKVSAEEGVSFLVRVYDSFGRKVWESARQTLEAGSEQVIDYQINEVLIGGFYLVVPYATTLDGLELRAAISPQVSGEAYRLMVPR